MSDAEDIDSDDEDDDLSPIDGSNQKEPDVKNQRIAKGRKPNNGPIVNKYSNYSSLRYKVEVKFDIKTQGLLPGIMTN